jgi:hypothetical protein
MVGSLGNDAISGKIQSYHRATPRPEALPMASVFHQRIHEVGLKTQNYNDGFDNFVRKFNQTEEMMATIAVALGCQDDHGWAVYCTQDSRRCPLLGKVDGLADNETLWKSLSAWASFEPRKANRRRAPVSCFIRSKHPTFSRNIGTTWPVSVTTRTLPQNHHTARSTCEYFRELWQP